MTCPACDEGTPQAAAPRKAYRCSCGHSPSAHGKVTYPRYRRPCDMCVNCGRIAAEHQHSACQYRACPCSDLDQRTEAA